MEFDEVSQEDNKQFAVDSRSAFAAYSSTHQTVDGSILLLRERSLGKSGCIEYTVEKPKAGLWESLEFRIFLLSIVCLSLSVGCYSSLQGAFLFSLLSIIICYHMFWSIDKEILLVTVPLGIQFTSVFRSGLQTTCFIPWHCVKDVYIVEAISLYRVLFNLVVLTESESNKEDARKLKLVPLFQGTKPRLNCLESIYQSISTLLPQLKQSSLNKM